MDGSWYLTRHGERPRRYPDHMIRVQLGNDEWTATGYRVHDLALLATTAEHDVVGHLGPDLLGDDWDRDEALRRLITVPERAIGDALLDQTALAGIGNLYKSEVLFLRGINPWRNVQDVADLGAVVDLAHELLLRNRDHPEQSTTGNLRPGEQHWVYRRAGERCRRCGTTIERADQGPDGQVRGTYWCPACQPSS
jgi:endonuclease-8